jgi:hypothetical protein
VASPEIVRYLSSGVKSKVLEVKEKFVSFVHVLTAPPHVNVRNRAFLQKLTGSSVIASMTDLLGSENLVITETQSLAIEILARIYQRFSHRTWFYCYYEQNGIQFCCQRNGCSGLQPQ